MEPPLASSSRRARSGRNLSRIDALEGLGAEVVAAPWNGDVGPFEGADLVVLRSTWDHHYALDEFVGWLSRLEASGTAVQNSPALARWNLGKRYLLDLRERGVPLTETFVVADTSGGAFKELAARLGGRHVVVKPVWGASGYGVKRLERGSSLPRSDRPLLVQEYLPEVARDGERSRAARRCCRLPECPVHARVDGVMREGRLLLTELELIEPGLSLDLAPQAAGRFASEVLAAAWRH